MSVTTPPAAGNVVALVASHASANFHLLIINEIYSNADGTVQYVELREHGRRRRESTWRSHADQHEHRKPA